jgi:hypothetical protein
VKISFSQQQKKTKQQKERPKVGIKKQFLLFRTAPGGTRKEQPKKMCGKNVQKRKVEN